MRYSRYIRNVGRVFRNLVPKSSKWRKEFNSERRAGSYDKAIDIFALRRAERLRVIETILNRRSRQELKILELGAGTGLITERLAELNTKAHITAVDGAKKMVNKAQSKDFARTHKNRIKWVLADFSDQSWMNKVSGPFDLIVTVDSLHHLSHQRKKELYKELHNCLIRDGQFIISDHMSTQDPYFEDPQYVLWVQEVFEHLKLIEKDSEIGAILEKYLSWSFDSFQDVSVSRFRKWITAGLKEEGENPMSLMEHIDVMRHIGYRNVVVEYRYSNFAIISARK